MKISHDLRSGLTDACSIEEGQEGKADSQTDDGFSRTRRNTRRPNGRYGRVNNVLRTCQFAGLAERCNPARFTMLVYHVPYSGATG